MLTNKDIEFVQYLLQSTQEGKIRWEPTATTNEFVSSLKGKYKVILKQISSTRYMSMLDTEDRQLLSVGSDEYGPVWDLFDTARRVAYDVDSAIDEILRD